MGEDRRPAVCASTGTGSSSWCPRQARTRRWSGQSAPSSPWSSSPNNEATLAALSAEKRAELKDRAKEQALLARVAVCNHVNLLYVPGPDGLDAVELDVVTQASVKPNQADAILERLAAMGKTQAAGDKPIDPGYIKVKLGALLDTQPAHHGAGPRVRAAD